MERVDFDLEEYRALRSEIIQSMDDGNQIVAFGLAAVGLVLGAGLSSKETLLGFLVLSFFLPIITALVLSMWFAAQERIARASHYLSGVETRIKAACRDEGSISWEAWLRSPRSDGQYQHFWSTQQAGIGLFVVIMASSILIGLVTGGSGVSARLKGLVVASSVVISGLLTLQVMRRYKNWKLWLITHYDPETLKPRSEDPVSP